MLLASVLRPLALEIVAFLAGVIKDTPIDIEASSDNEAAEPAGPCVLVMDPLRNRTGSHDAARIAAYLRARDSGLPATVRH